MGKSGIIIKDHINWLHTVTMQTVGTKIDKKVFSIGLRLEFPPLCHPHQCENLGELVGDQAGSTLSTRQGLLSGAE